jgi:branched-chain amino acid transport system substrate-binding protein
MRMPAREGSLMLKKAKCTVCLAFLLAASGACSRPSGPGLSDREVILGMTAPLSGPAAAWGTVSRGAQAWAAHVNAGGGVHGRQIRVVVKDDGYLPGRAVANLTEMKDSTFAVVGLTGTAVLNATKDVVAEAAIPVVFPFGNPRVWARQPRAKVERVFAVYPDYESEGAFLAEQAVTRGGAHTLAVFYQNDDYGKDGLAGLRRGLQRVGAALVAEVPYDLQDREMSIHALKIKDAGSDAVVLFSTTTHGASLVKEMAKVGYRPIIFASFPLGDRQVMFRLLGELWEGAYFDVNASVVGEPEADRVLQVLLQEDPTLKGREGFALNGATAMSLAVEGLRRGGRDLSRESFVAGLEGLRDWTPEGLGAPITFGPGRRHGLNCVRLLRAGPAAEASFTVVTPYQSFGPLF